MAKIASPYPLDILLELQPPVQPEAEHDDLRTAQHAPSEALVLSLPRNLSDVVISNTLLALAPRDVVPKVVHGCGCDPPIGAIDEPIDERGHAGPLRAYDDHVDIDEC